MGPTRDGDAIPMDIGQAEAMMANEEGWDETPDEFIDAEEEPDEAETVYVAAATPAEAYVLLPRPRGPSASDRCRRCGKYGHWARQCREELPNARTQQSHPKA